MTRNRPSRRRVALVLALVLPALSGCGASGPTVHPVRGHVVLSGDEVSKLTGHGIEASLTSDPTVRASGVIEADGQFTLETLHEGKIYRGVKEGIYEARIVLADDDVQTRRPPIAKRYLQFKTSGLSLQVPATGEVQLNVSTK